MIHTQTYRINVHQPEREGSSVWDGTLLLLCFPHYDPFRHTFSPARERARPGFGRVGHLLFYTVSGGGPATLSCLVLSSLASPSLPSPPSPPGRVLYRTTPLPTRPTSPTDSAPSARAWRATLIPLSLSIIMAWVRMDGDAFSLFLKLSSCEGPSFGSWILLNPGST